MPTEIKIKLAPTAISDPKYIPSYANNGDAGLDLVSIEDVTILAGDRLLVKTSIDSMELPNGTVGLVCPRSGLALKYGITVLNAPGIIDSGYRGPICVILHNTSVHNFTIFRGDRIAQLVITPFVSATITITQEYLSETERGDGGFGSSDS